MSLFSVFKKQAPVGTDLDKITATFNQIEQNTSWNIKGKLLFGYFFLDPEQQKLTAFAAKMKQKGFNTADLAKVSNNMYRLHLEEEAIHTPKSLVENNLMFHKFAAEFKIARFDGYDVGPVPNNK